MEHRACVRPVRALVDGPEAFWSTLGRQSGFDAHAFGAFVRRHALFCWLGPVLDDPRATGTFPEEFLELLKAKAPAPVAQPRRPAQPAEFAQPRSPEPEAAKEAEPPAAQRRFRARVKQSATTRTRAILVFAESAEDAAEKALAEAGAGWSLLEVASR